MEAHVLNLDRPRKLHYGFKAMRIIRDKFAGEKELTDVLEINVDEIPYFAYVGLLRDDESLTPEKVEDLIDDAIPDTYTTLQVVDIITKAITEQVGAVPKKKAKREIPKKKKKT